MANYKIKVNNEADSKEAQELFFELGYKLGAVANKHFPVMVVAHDCGYGPVSTTATCMNHENHKDYQELTLPQLRDLVAQSKSTDQGLISGADALRALADGFDVLYIYKDAKDQIDKFVNVRDHNLQIADFFSDKWVFKIKTRTIKLSLEIPAPFEPKVGETYYFITTSNSQGFDFTEFEDSDGDELYMQLGAYRSASDASKAFEALRGGIKG